jgi:hypothetical protein
MAQIIEKRERQEPEPTEEEKKSAKKNGKKDSKSKSDSKTKGKGHNTMGDFDYYVHYIECES